MYFKVNIFIIKNIKKNNKSKRENYLYLYLNYYYIIINNFKKEEL
jgi:hypothetical protein